MSVELALHDPSLWPLRMVRSEVAAALRISERELRRRVAQGRFPAADDGHSWSRATVWRYAEGGVREFERDHERRVERTKRDGLHVVGGRK